MTGLSSSPTAKRLRAILFRGGARTCRTPRSERSAGSAAIVTSRVSVHNEEHTAIVPHKRGRRKPQENVLAEEGPRRRRDRGNIREKPHSASSCQQNARSQIAARSTIGARLTTTRCAISGRVSRNRSTTASRHGRGGERSEGSEQAGAFLRRGEAIRGRCRPASAAKRKRECRTRQPTA